MPRLLPQSAKFRFFCLLLLTLAFHPRFANSQETPGPTAISRGATLLQQGDVLRSIDLLNASARATDSPDVKAAAAGALGVAQLQAQHFDLAEPLLKQAHAFYSGVERAKYALYLGNLTTVQKRNDEAKQYYQEAFSLAGTDLDIQLSASLNLVRLAPDPERLDRLNALSGQLIGIDAARSKDFARHHLNLGNQARMLGAKGLRLSYVHLEKARQLAVANSSHHLHVEALDALAQLYEDQGRKEDALVLSQQAIEIASKQDHGTVADILISLEWRQARLLRSQGKNQSALAAYQRALYQIELVRQDIPVVYEDGSSSFRTTLEPIYLGFVDLQLQQIDKQASTVQTERLRNVIDTMELIKQTELHDFLGDRCAVETVQGGISEQIIAGTAVLYPIILPNRIELLLQTSTGITRRSVDIDNTTLKRVATEFAADLRAGGPDFMGRGQKLYDWLLRPFEDVIAAQRVQSLVVVPDGVIRIVPIAALHDGKQFAIEKYAISMVTGMSVTNSSTARTRKVVPLLAGVSEPGAVVEKMGPLLAAQVFQAPPEGASRGLAQTHQLRSVKAEDAAVAAKPDPSRSQRALDKLRARLALPGVMDEIKSLGQILGGTTLLNADFTVDHFRTDAETGEFRVVHIASHGIFGGSAETSFIMAHDDVITMNGLQSLLRAEKFQRNPIELLTLSACQTAEGNERAPLGIAGAAIKARAKSVLGTLWPVEDNAARTLMETFYAGIATDKLSKTEALQKAQIQLIAQADSNHPFFWAPFVLIGNWK